MQKASLTRTALKHHAAAGARPAAVVSCGVGTERAVTHGPSQEVESMRAASDSHLLVMPVLSVHDAGGRTYHMFFVHPEKEG